MGVGTIGTVSVAPETFNKLWGVNVCDYTYNSKQADFETLLIRVSTTRASTIEAEIVPVSTIVRRRNEQLEDLGVALSEISGLQAVFENEDKKDSSLEVTETTAKLVNSLSPDGKTVIPQNAGDNRYYATKSQAAEASELLKTRMDKLNNDSQNDLTRMQSLVDKRDESFKTASSLMTSVSDTRGNLIKSIG